VDIRLGPPHAQRATGTAGKRSASAPRPARRVAQSGAASSRPMASVGASTSAAEPSFSLSRPTYANSGDESQALVGQILRMRLDDPPPLRDRRPRKFTINDAVRTILGGNQNPRDRLSRFRSCVEDLLEFQVASDKDFSTEIGVLTQWIEWQEMELQESSRGGGDPSH
jgi:hypothetical protein